MEKYSIWEDAIYAATGQTSFIYNIYDEDNTLLYTGKAYSRPNTGLIEINVSQIVRNYLNCEFPAEAFNLSTFQEGQVILPNAVLGFTLTNEKGTELESYKFLNCWDYKTFYRFIDNTTMNYNINQPVNNHTAIGQYTFVSTLLKTDKVRVAIGSVDSGATSCGYGALYYSTSLGGWDSFLIEGNIIKKDSYERYTIENKWIADTLQPGTRTLVNTIDESWTLNTHLLTDEEAKILAEHLFGSNNVYFHSFADNTITPVVITDTSVDYKNWRNQKRKRFYLTINIKSCQPKQRI